MVSLSHVDVNCEVLPIVKYHWQAGRQTDRQTGRQTDRQTDRQRQIFIDLKTPLRARRAIDFNSETVIRGTRSP